MNAPALVARAANTAMLFACVTACLNGPRAQAAEPQPSPSPSLPPSPPPAGTAGTPAPPPPPPGTPDTAATAAPVPAPMSPQAQAHYDRGLQLYAARDYAGAVRALEQGFAIEPRREFLFAEAQSFRLAGDCGRAIPLYQRFIDSGAQPVQAQAARLGVDRCAPGRTSSQSAQSAPSPAPATTPPRPTDNGPRVEERPSWWRDPWVLTSAGLGTVALGVGVGMFIASDRSVAEAQSPRTTTEPEYHRLWAKATQRREIAIVGLAAGVGLLAAGGARAWWLSRHERATGNGGGEGAGHRLSLVPGAGGATLLWEDSF